MFDTVAKNTLVPLVLRLGLAAIFIFNGMEKVRGEGNEFGANSLRKLPDPPHKVVQMLVAWGEFVGGIALAIGFLTRLAAVGIAAIMAGAIYTVHGPKGFSLGDGGYEYNFAILVICAAVILLGGGALAADRIFRVRPKNPVAGS